MNIDTLFDDRLLACLDRYSDIKESIGTNLRKSIDKSKNSEIIIPVIGMQGMGKSTLINGLLGENILPNDADETTCVPVEVKYGTDECAKVHFFDKEDVIIVHTRKELNEYVDNNYNPANEKHVARIELFRKSALLKDGMVIVDLPGVGSLTKENENTTKRYIENLCSAIFVIPTVPTIRYQETLFIKSLWAQFSKAIFVQNVWLEETKAEIEESVDHNKKVLKKLADELHNPFGEDIILVNAYNAVEGALNKDLSLVKSSNISTLYNKIVELSSNWESDKEKFLRERLLLSLEYACAVIQRRLSDAQKSREELEANNKKRIEAFEQGTIDLSEKIESIKKYLRDKDDEVFLTVKKNASDCAKRIRASIFKVIDSGVYDGEHLSRAFEDIQKDEIKEYTDDIINLFMNIKYEIESKFIELSQFEINENISIQAASLNSKEALKWEQGAQVGLNIGGAAVGGLAATGVAGALATAAGVSATSGPPGWLVFGVGLAIYGLFSFAGWGIKKLKQNDRAYQAKREVAPHIDQIERSLLRTSREKFSEFASSCNTILDNILSRRNEEKVRFVNSLNSALDESQVQELQNDLNFIITKQKELQNV